MSYLSYYVPFLVLIISLYYSFYFLTNDWQKSVKFIFKKVQKINDLNKIERSLEEKIFKTDDANKMKYRVNKITGTKATRSERLKDRVNQVVLNQYHSWSYLSYIIATFICMGVAVVAGKILQNTGVMIILIGVFATFPYLFLNFRIKSINRDKDKKLLIVMGNIQSTYLNRDSFVQAVKETLDTIPYPLYSHFKLFVDEMFYFGTFNMDEAADRLAYAVNNHFFNEFVQLAKQAEQGSPGLKYTMKSVPQDYQRFLDKNEKYARIVEDYNIQFLLRIIMFPFMIGFIKLVSDEYYRIILYHPLGKLTLLVMTIVYVVASFIFMRYNKDIKYEL